MLFSHIYHQIYHHLFSYTYQNSLGFHSKSRQNRDLVSESMIARFIETLNIA